MNINFEDALSRLAQDPSDLVAWSVVLDAFEHKVPLSRTINKKSLENNITLFLASPDFSNQGAVTSVLHGNASGNPSWGPITTNDISDYNVSFPKLQPVNTGRILGRTTAGVGVIEQLTGTQLTTLLDLFSTSSTTKGLVPGSNGLSGQYFLKSDGTWSIPSVSLHSGLGNLDYGSSGHTGFEPEIPYGVEGQYLGGDKLWHNLADFGETISAKHNQLSNLEGGDGVHYYHIGAQTSTNVGYITDSTADAVPSNLTISEQGVHVAVDGTTSAYIALTWDAINTNTFDHYMIRYKKSSYTYYTYLDSKTNTIVIEGLVPNVSYDFSVASVNKFGIVSLYCITVTAVTEKDSTPPADVVTTSAIGGIQTAIVNWDAVADKDLSTYRIYRNTVNDSAGAILIGSSKTNYLVDGGRTGGQIYYYWVKAEDTSGNLSVNFSNVQSATPRNVVSLDTALAHQGWTQTCSFTVVDANTVAWTGGTFTTSGNVTYNITGGDTGDMVAKTYIYLDIEVSTTTYQKTTNAGLAVGDSKVLIAVCQNGSVEATFFILNDQSMNINAAQIVAGSITANEIAVGTIQASNIDTDTITNLNNLVIGAPQILLQGQVTLSSWQGTDVTKINGGSIEANTITTNQLNFTPLDGSSIIATINASAEGIKIDADNISISGATTFDSGYNPLNKLEKLGGSYDSAGSGARVRIFPDSNTGIQVIDDTGNDVFKTVIGGSNIGDVIIGNYAGGQGIFYDKSTSTTTFLGVVNARNSKLSTTPVTAGDLTGSVSTIQAASPSSSEIYQVTLNGSSGSVTITLDGTSDIATYNESLEQTAADFATTAYYPGIVVTNPEAPSATILFTKASGNISFSASTNGITLINPHVVQGYSAGLSQIDQITLSGTSGYCTITSNDTSGFVYGSYATLGGDWITQSASEFVSKYQSVFNAKNITLSSANHIITLTGSTNVPFNPITTCNNAQGAVGSISIVGNDIFEQTVDNDYGTLYINDRGYSGGTSHFRTLSIGDGKGDTMFKIYGWAHQIQARLQSISSPGTTVYGTLYVDSNGFVKLL